MMLNIQEYRSLNRMSQVESVVIWCVSTKKICQCVSLPFSSSRCCANFDEMNDHAYKTNFRVLNDP